jgi:hypothetical protein
VEAWDGTDLEDGSADNPLDYENGGGGGGGYNGDFTFSGDEEDDWDLDVISNDTASDSEEETLAPAPEADPITSDALDDTFAEDVSEVEYDDEGIPIVASQSVDVTATPDDPQPIDVWSNAAYASAPDLGSIVTVDQSVTVTATPDDPQPIDVSGDHDFVTTPIYAAMGETEAGDEDEDSAIFDLTKNYALQFNAPPPAFDSPGTKPSQKPQQGGFPAAPATKAPAAPATKQSWLWLIVLLMVAVAVWYEEAG